MKRVTIFIALCGIILGAQAAPKEQPDARYKLIRQSYTVNADGTIDYNFHKEITILRNRALTAYADKGETFIVYNPSFETLKINSSYTIRKDGSRVETPQNAFVNQLPSNCQNCGRYNGLREMAIVHTGMEYGCTIVLDYTIHRKSTHLFANIQLTQDCPVDKYEITVDIPKDQFLSHTINSIGKSAKNIKVDSNGHTFHMVAENIDQSYVDAYLPANEELYPIITFCNDKKALTSPMCWLHFDNNEVCNAAESQMTMISENDPVQYAQAIHNYVVDNISLNDINPALVDYQVASAEQTWRSNCGNAADKAQLLAALLRQVKIQAYAIAPDRVDFNVNGTDYHFSPIAKGDPITNQPATGTISHSKDTTLAWNGTDISNNYSQLTLPDVHDCHFNAAYLTGTRTAPLHISKLNINNTYRISLPTGAKLLSKAIHTKSEGNNKNWTISIDISQEGNTLIVKRLFLINKDTNISGKDYQSFRQSVADWETTSTLTIKK
jgi:hypothetical protein